VVKLFAMEENTSSDNELLIDKVLERAKKPTSPMSLTADVLKQRQQLNEEISNKLAETTEESPSEETKETEDTQREDEESSGDTETSPETDTEEKTDDTEGENKEDITSLIGSDLKKEEPATESKALRVTLNNIFNPIKEHHRRYVQSLSPYALESQALPIKEQPIVYVKESVTESLNNLVTLSNTYVDNNTTFISNMSTSVKSLNERITVFKQFIAVEKYHFTNKLVSDKDILSNICTVDKSDPRDTTRFMLEYIESSKKATGLVTSNSFSELTSSYLNSNFNQEDDDLVYGKVIPGFSLIKVHTPTYQNYLSTKIEDYQYYKLKVLKTEDLYNLTSIGITEDKELQFIMSNVDKLLVNVTLSVDNLHDINGFFTKFIEEVKAMIYDIEHDKYTNLAQVGIDEKVQDFIKFKLAIEAYYINVNTMIEYLTGLMSVLNVTVELKE
jgi:hypothetical protein